ncbi:MAG: putative hemolysin [Enterobacteriaceae bacterium]
MRSILTYLILPFLLTACAAKEEPPARHTPYPLASMSSHAESQCLQSGGIPGEAHSLQGEAFAVCQLANGKRCDENALLEGTCAR